MIGVFSTPSSLEPTVSEHIVGGDDFGFWNSWGRVGRGHCRFVGAVRRAWAYEVGGALVVGVPDYSIVTNILRRRKATCNEINLPRPGRPLPGLGRKSCGMDRLRRAHLESKITNQSPQ